MILSTLLVKETILWYIHIHMSGGGFMVDHGLARIFKLWKKKNNKNIYICNENLRFFLLKTISKYSLNFILTLQHPLVLVRYILIF